MTFEAHTVVLTSGTFMNGLIHVGDQNFGGGRAGERASTGITEELIQLGFEAGRMKTGTPPRIDGRTIDFNLMEEQPGDEDPGQFSFLGQSKLEKQRSCWITHTSQEVHDTLKKGFDRSPSLTGLFEVLVRDIALLLRIKLTDLPRKTRTKSSLNLRVGTP